MRVLVPFGRGNKTNVAFVYQIIEELDQDFETKDILEIIDQRRLISDELMKLAFFMSKRYLSNIQSSLKQVLPPTEIKNIKTFYYNKANQNNDIFKFLEKRRQMDEITKKFGDIKDEILALVDKGEIGVSYDIKSSHKVKYDEYARIKSNNVDLLNKNAKKQKAILEYLSRNNNSKVSDILSNTQASKASLDSLAKKNLVEIYKKLSLIHI